jgi:hypothetical protein
MEIIYPTYPFLWNYNDMFNNIEYKTVPLTNDFNEEIKNLTELFPNKNIVKITQIIKNDNINELILNLQTTYLSRLREFESDDYNLKINTIHKIDYKKKVPVFVYDPYDNLEIQEYNSQNICIIKNLEIIKENINSIPLLYTRTHTIKKIIRFSPSNNSKIKFKNNENSIFYTITEFSIVMNDIIFN